MARKLQPHEKDPYAIVSTVNELADGRSNNVGSVTLTPGATTTVVSFANASIGSAICLSPRTANAAAAIPTTFISVKLNGSFTLTHANNAQVDRTFDFACVGVRRNRRRIPDAGVLRSPAFTTTLAALVGGLFRVRGRARGYGMSRKPSH